MGISVTLLPASDDEIHGYVASPKIVDARFACVISSPAHLCHLHDRWAALHVLCTGDVNDDGPPLGLLMAGQVEIRGAADPTFGIFAAGVSSWRTALDAISDEEFQRRCFRTDLLHAGPGGAHVYPGRWPDAMTESLARELLLYFDRLRQFVRTIADQRSGTVFSRYEDF